MSRVEILIVLAVRTFDLAVVTRSKWTNELVLDLSVFERALKERKVSGLGSAEALCEFKTVVGLNALYFYAEL